MKRLRNSHLCPGLHAAAVRVFAKNHENRKVNDFFESQLRKIANQTIFRVTCDFFALLRQVNNHLSRNPVVDLQNLRKLRKIRSLMIFPQFFVSKILQFLQLFVNFAKIANIADLAGALEFYNVSKFWEFVQFFANFSAACRLGRRQFCKIFQQKKPHIPIANHFSCICNLIKIHFFPRLAWIAWLTGTQIVRPPHLPKDS